ncbi:three-Cys-motif partner protein TcmP [Amycolatopsis sp. NEAU-NG30]|uniref:Three-Cys-motif partner protein TcmP n=1 Tax=Amycolatopsis melonis TaxID=3156488 RepID=A0ABV0LNU4_9PSEU
MEDTLWPLEPATEAKHRLYKRYLGGWWAKMLQPNAKGFSWPKVTYVDAFAGPGRYEGGEEGSPVFVLKGLLEHAARDRMDLRRDRVQLAFIEKRRDRFEYLKAELARKFGDLTTLPVRVEVRRGDAATETTRVLNKFNAWGNPMLTIFDSWGNVNVPLSLLHRIAGNGGSESIVTFGPNWFSRREEQNPDQLDAVFGGHEYWQRADRETSPDERWRVWLSTYRDALGRAGFEYRLQFQVVPRTGQPLYLVYGTKHPAGVEVMKDAMWKVDPEGGTLFRDPRTRGAEIIGQTDLFGTGGAVHPELRELVVQRLRDGSVTVGVLRDWLERETSRWRGTHAPQAVRALVDEGVLRIDPVGRVTRGSEVKLL